MGLNGKKRQRLCVSNPLFLLHDLPSQKADNMLCKLVLVPLAQQEMEPEENDIPTWKYCRCLNLLNLTNGYWQVPVAQGDQEKIAFTVIRSVSLPW